VEHKNLAKLKPGLTRIQAIPASLFSTRGRNTHFVYSESLQSTAPCLWLGAFMASSRGV